MNTSGPASRTRLDLAVRHQTAGRLREAVTIYQDLLRATPTDADLMQRLGVALAQLGMPGEGARLLAASLELSPDRPSVLLNLARALLASKHPEDALRCCDRALALDASMADAHRLRGSALAAMGRSDEALAHWAQAVRLAPADARALIDLGVALASSDRAPDALACFERAIALDAKQAPAHHNLAVLAARMGDHDRALASFERAVTLQPHEASLHNNRGASLKALGRWVEALQSFSTALAIDPADGQCWHNRAAVNLLLENYPQAANDYREALARRGENAPDLIGFGAALLGMGRNAEALPPLERAAVLQPEEFDAHVQLGVARLRLEQPAQALASFDRALGLKRERPEVLNNRGVALAALGRTDDALQSFIESAALAGGKADTHTNIGVLFKSIGRYREAGWSFDRALALQPDDPAASFELAFLRLSLGDFRGGWPLYEARFRVPALAIPPRDFAAPRWDGKAPLAGKVLLVHAEQGLGDTIQFARYLPLLAGRGATVWFEVMPQLKTLMGSLPGSIRLLARGEPLPPVDFHIPLASLPLAFDTDMATIPGSVPYLAAEPARVASWAIRMHGLKGLRVGIAWQGNMQVERLIWARGRSIPLAALEPLAAMPNVTLVSLQKGRGSEQLQTVPFRDRILDLGEKFDAGPDAFLDATAVMANLDLIITSDTSIAHLAGALARPVWVVLSAAADWRWLLERADSPWYPSMRLFRQPDRTRGWEPVVQDLAAALLRAECP